MPFKDLEQIAYRPSEAFFLGFLRGLSELVKGLSEFFKGLSKAFGAF